MLVAPITCALIGAALPFTPLAGFLGFATLPVSFFLILLGMIATYLLLVEIAKRRFYAVQAHPRRPRPTQQQRHQRRLQRRAVRFIHYPTPQPRGRRPGPGPDRPATGRRQPAHDQRSTLGNPD
jgi:Mg2+-importing ATPase